MGKTIFDKIWKLHKIEDLGGDTSLILIDRILLHERTGGVALRSLEETNRKINDPKQVFVTMDHIVDTFPGRNDNTIMPTGRNFIQVTREAAKKAKVKLFDLNDSEQGIGHVISPELGIILPGSTLVCPDSHTCSQGALGGLAWGIGSSEAEHALATSTLRVKRPKTMRITINGSLQAGVTAKDMALHIVSELGSSGAKGHIIEYAGSTIKSLDVEARLTLCNMATEIAAFTAIIAPDNTVFNYLKDRKYAPKGEQWDLALSSWQTLFSDESATFDTEFEMDAEDIQPMVSWGVSPQQSIPISYPIPELKDVIHRDSEEIYNRALNYMDLKPGQNLSELPLDAAFIGSCTNSRITDLRKAAAILKNRKVAKDIKAICVPGSTQVKLQAEAEGLDQIFLDAGFEWRESGCSMCFFAGGESFGEKERVITSTNRNFESRQGPKTRSHLASPEVVAASAIRGHIIAPSELIGE